MDRRHTGCAVHHLGVVKLSGVREDVLSTQSDRAVSLFGRLFPAIQRFRFQPRPRAGLLRQQHHSR